MKKALLLLLTAGLLLAFFGCGNSVSAPETVAVSSAAEQTQPAETEAEVTDWERFRAYLQENGDAVTEADLSTDADALTKKIVIKGKDNEILIRFEMINRQNVSGYSTFAKVTAQLALPENECSVEMDFLTEISANQGSLKEVSTYKGTYAWDISQYAEGDEVVGTAVHNYVDVNGNYTHKDETVGYKITGIVEPICDALRKALSESGLGITMADLGFVNY